MSSQQIQPIDQCINVYHEHTSIVAERSPSQRLVHVQLLFPHAIPFSLELAPPREVPADIRLVRLKTTTVRAEQSQLTGETQSVIKDRLEEWRDNQLWGN